MSNHYENGFIPCLADHFYSFANAMEHPEGVADVYSIFYSKLDPYELFIDSFEAAIDATVARQHRTKYIQSCALLYLISPKVQQKFEYHANEVMYTKRFILRGSAKPSFNDGINYDTPEEDGLYFIGETHFNPYTREEFYWVKIGMSTKLNRRMKEYDTHNPMLWRIDYKIGSAAEERIYHQQLGQKAIAKCNHNDEWFLVDRNTYLAMCEKGFSYFN